VLQLFIFLINIEQTKGLKENKSHYKKRREVIFFKGYFIASLDIDNL
jgi:hypothetical protein